MAWQAQRSGGYEGWWKGGGPRWNSTSRLESRLIGRLGQKIQSFGRGKFHILGGGRIGGDLFEKRGGLLVPEEPEGNEGDDADFGILVPGGGAEGRDDAGIDEFGDGFHALDSFNAERVGDFGEQNLGAAAVVEPNQGQGGDDLGGAVGRFQGGEVGLGLGFLSQFQEGAPGEAADVGVGVLQHFEKDGDEIGVAALAKKAGRGGAGEPVLVLGGRAENFGGLFWLEDPAGFSGFAADGGIGIFEAGFDEAAGGGAIGRIEGEGLEGVGADGGEAILQRFPVRLGLGMKAEDLAGFRGGNFGLTQEESQMEAFLAKGGAVRGFLERGVDQGAGLLKAAGLEKLVGAAGRIVPWAGAGGEKEQRQKDKKGNMTHTITFTVTFTKKKEGMVEKGGLKIRKLPGFFREAGPEIKCNTYYMEFKDWMGRV